MKKIRSIGTEQIKIRSIGTTNTRVDSTFLEKSLGAEKLGIKAETRQPSISLLALSQFFSKRLKSSGGRPSLSGTQKQRTKISLLEDDWGKLKKLSSYYKEKEGINVTPSQIASAALHKSLEKLNI